MTGSRLIVGIHLKVFTPNSEDIVNVLLPICCHIGSGMSYLRNEDTVALLLCNDL